MPIERSQSPSRSRRHFLVSSETVLTTAGTAMVVVPAIANASGKRVLVAEANPAKRTAGSGDQIRPSTYRAPKTALVDLRRCISATTWPTPDLVDGKGTHVATCDLHDRTARDLSRTASVKWNAS